MAEIVRDVRTLQCEKFLTDDVLLVCRRVLNVCDVSLFGNHERIIRENIRNILRDWELHRLLPLGPRYLRRVPMADKVAITRAQE